MNTVIEQKVEQIRSNISTDELEAMTRPFSLADAIREGSTVSTQEYGWGDGETMCSLSAAVCSAIARGYINP